jgi:hypothetical protein
MNLLRVNQGVVMCRTVAKKHPGANANALTDGRAYDEASGAAVLFGTPVSIEPVGVAGK